MTEKTAMNKSKNFSAVNLALTSAAAVLLPVCICTLSKNSLDFSRDYLAVCREFAGQGPIFTVLLVSLLFGAVISVKNMQGLLCVLIFNLTLCIILPDDRTVVFCGIYFILAAVFYCIVRPLLCKAVSYAGGHDSSADAVGKR